MEVKNHVGKCKKAIETTEVLINSVLILRLLQKRDSALDGLGFASRRMALLRYVRLQIKIIH